MDDEARDFYDLIKDAVENETGFSITVGGSDEPLQYSPAMARGAFKAFEMMYMKEIDIANHMVGMAQHLMRFEEVTSGELLMQIQQAGVAIAAAVVRIWIDLPEDDRPKWLNGFCEPVLDAFTSETDD